MEKKSIEEFKPTPKQREVSKMLQTAARHIMLFGGSRSGKTFFLLRAIFIRAMNAPESKHLIIRDKFNAVKKSIWYDNFPKMMAVCFPKVTLNENKTDLFLELPNGSQIWMGGLDDSKHVEKILGNEYSTIYFNECSQISYTSKTIALTRLAENKGLVNKAFYDCNPPDMQHWAYREFIEHVTPIDKKPLKPDNYISLLMNPIDNTANLPDGYIDDILENLPEAQRRRFLLGEWVSQVDGAVFGVELEAIRKKGQLTTVRYDPNHEVHTWWDIGYTDYTAIWFVQYVGTEIRLIDYDQDHKKDLTHYVKMLKEKGYNYGLHNLPHDAGYKSLLSGGKTVYDQLKKKYPRAEFRVHKRVKDTQTKIYSARTFFARCVFDQGLCIDGLECLRNYRYTWNEAKDTWNDEPLHDKYSHGSSAFADLSIGYRESMGEPLPDESNPSGTPTFNQLMQSGNNDTPRNRI